MYCRGQSSYLDLLRRIASEGEGARRRLVMLGTMGGKTRLVNGGGYLAKGGPEGGFRARGACLRRRVFALYGDEDDERVFVELLRARQRGQLVVVAFED